MKNTAHTKKLIGEIFQEIGNAIESGQYQNKVKVGITLLGSEHGFENIVKGAELAQSKSKDIEVILIGPHVQTSLPIIEANSEEESFKLMEECLENGSLQACVTMHYNFPIGVSTVGKVVTPGFGKEMFLATTTGTSSIHRVEGMIKNALYGIATAKAMGVKEPTVGILNLDGARQVERVLKKLQGNGYPIHFASSGRQDGGIVMRGNDLLMATPDIMVMDTLTGNVMMKVLSSFTTGGNYESVGYGYGPGVGDNYDKIILILSRASGIPVVANALQYAADLAKGSLQDVAKKELDQAKKAGLEEFVKELDQNKETDDTVKMPEKQIVTGQIAGIDILDLEDAMKALWKESIYAESGMGCTGPILLVNEQNLEIALKALSKHGYVAQEGEDC